MLIGGGQITNRSTFIYKRGIISQTTSFEASSGNSWKIDIKNLLLFFSLFFISKHIVQQSDAFRIEEFTITEER